jgi:serine/threonine-protein kinase
VLDDVGVSAYSGVGNFVVSESGTFVYLSGTAGFKQAIFWLDSSGNLQPLYAEPGRYAHPRFSPDGKRLAFAVGSGSDIDLWVQDLDRGTTSRKSFLPGRNWWPVWTPDGEAIVFDSANRERRDIHWIRADGSGEAQRLTGDLQGLPRSFSPDGKWLAFKNAKAIWTAPLEAGSEHPRLGTAVRFLDDAAPMVPEAQFSPDGRWMAYISAESGIPEVLVRPFPGPGGQWQI